MALYGVKIGNIHTLKDWGLYFSERPKIGAPTPKYVYIDVPESDGQLDFTESLSGEVQYNNRVITITLTVLDSRNKWSNIYSKVLNYLQGRKMQLIFDEEPDFYYEGRIKVNEWQSSKYLSKIVLEANVNPYKYELSSSLEPWKWDPFNFETGIIRDYADLEINGTFTLEIMGRRMSVIPAFIVKDSTNGIDVTFDGETYHLPNGNTRVINIKLVEGMNTLVFSGKGTVSVDYRGGAL